MTSILALETTGSLCSVCLEVDGNRFEKTEHVARRHNELLLPMIQEVIVRSGMDINTLNAVAFDCGPGSFTGVRIAAAATQAIALATDAVVVRVESSRALALTFADEQTALPAGSFPADEFVLVTSIRSRKDLHYLASQLVAGERVRTLEPDVLCERMPPAGWGGTGEAARVCMGVGDQPAWWNGDIPFTAAVAATAAQVCKLAKQRLDAGEGQPAEQALPTYVSGDSPWRTRQ